MGGEESWIFERLEPGRIVVCQFGENGMEMRTKLDHAPIEPTLKVPSEWIAPLVTALSNVSPPDRAMANHLEDAKAVRDRLLAMLEKTHGV